MSTSIVIGAWRPASRSRAFSLGLTACAYGVVTICYLAATLWIAGTRSLGMDEVLAVWAARLPSVGAVVDAIWHGSEFSPPTYDLLLHALFATFGSSSIVARIPSILAVFVAACAMAKIASRSLGPAMGLTAFGLVLSSRAFDYAIQARPYALMLALLAVALALWRDDRERGGQPWRAAAIGALLGAGIALHVYSLIGILVVGLLEAIWTWHARRLRVVVWCALAAASLAVLAWLPLLTHLARFNQGDTSAPDFYARPDLSNLGRALGALGTFPEIAIALAVLILGRMMLRRGHTKRPVLPAAPIIWVAVALLAALPLAFGLSLVVTHAFSARYALPATLGVTLTIVVILARMGDGRAIAILMVPVICGSLLLHVREPDPTAQALALVSATAGDGNIVIGEGQMFLQLMDAAPPDVRARLVFLTAPPGLVPDDPTNEHQILRLRFVRPDLNVQPAFAFFSRHAEVKELFSAETTPDTILQWIAAQHWRVRIQRRGPAGAIAIVWPAGLPTS